MIPLYTLILAGLGGLKWLLSSKAARLERKFTRAALQAEALAQAMQMKPGNKPADPYMLAKSQYELGRLVEVRDGLETRFVRWQGNADKLNHFLTRLRAWKGRYVPYTIGFVDAAIILVALHLLGLPHGLNQETVKDWAQTIGR